MNDDTPLAVVQRYIEGFNRGDAALMEASFDTSGSILDGMAPHLWQGPNASRDWHCDVLAEGETHGATGYFVTLDHPIHNDTTGDSAYLVLPAAMTFEVGGKRINQAGALLTVALRKRTQGWRIAAWAWAKGKQ